MTATYNTSNRKKCALNAQFKVTLLSIGVTLNHAFCNLYSGLGSLECFVITKCPKFGQLILRKIFKIVVTMQMSDFKAKMHHIRFRLGLRPRPSWGTLQRSPDSVAGFKGPTSKGRGGRGKEGRE